MKRALPIVLAAAVLSCAAAAPTYEMAYNPFESGVTDRTPEGVTMDPVDKIGPWREAMGLLEASGMDVPDGFTPPHTLRVRHDYIATQPSESVRGQWLFGIYMMEHDLTRKGTMVVREKVVVFTTRDCLVHEILVHEYLHALHARLNHITEAYREWGTEDFVHHFFPAERTDFPACPESIP